MLLKSNRNREDESSELEEYKARAKTENEKHIGFRFARLLFAGKISCSMDGNGHSFYRRLPSIYYRMCYCKIQSLKTYKVKILFQFGDSVLYSVCVCNRELINSKMQNGSDLPTNFETQAILFSFKRDVFEFEQIYK